MSPASKPPARRVHIRTWGCQMNVYDSDRMADVLAAEGYAPTDDPQQADLIILNTCHIREKAAEKVYSEIGRLKPMKAQRPGQLIAVAGCVAQAEGAEILARAPAVDLVFGPQTYHELPALLARARRDGGGVVATDFPVEAKFDHLPGEGRAPGATAFLSVQEGCDKFCTFCVVPYTRGAEFSRPVAQVEEEARRLVAAGARELTLLGQNVNAYHGADGAGGSASLADLLARLSEIDGLARLRYTTSHPQDMDQALIDAHRDLPKVMPYLHLPVQAGSDRILRAMNRRHSADEYRQIIHRLRSARPDLALSGDFIVGFPGETDEDFAQTLRLVTDVGYASAYSFKYSARPGTPAANSSAQVPAPVMAERLEALQQVLAAQQAAFNARFVGQTVEVLFDRPGRRPGQLLGRTAHNISLHADAPASLMGHVVPVQVTEAGAHSLTGTVTAAAAA